MTSGETTSVTLPVALIHDWSAAESSARALDVMAQWLPTLVQADRASITLFTADRLGLAVSRLIGASAIPSGTILPVEGTAVGRCALEGAPRITLNSVDTDLADIRQLAAGGLLSSLNAPLVSANECFGTLNIAREAENAFDERDVVLLASIAEVLGAVLLTLHHRKSERRLASVDELTGLANRRSILQRLRTSLETTGTRSPVLFMDLDGFKLINDAYGHAVGDAMLVEMSRRFLEETGPDHCVGRIGGDEFLVLCEAGGDHASARRLAHHLLVSCTGPIDVGAVELAPQLSIGVAAPASDVVSVEELLAQADRAMYEAKRTGVHVVEADDNLRHDADLIAAIDHDLDRAMANDEIEFYFQPIRHLRTNTILGCESLVRWFHPDLGLVPPPLLIERAEATDRIDAFTTWALDNVARQWARFRASQPVFDDKAVSFNLSPRQLGWGGYVRAHMATLDRYNLSPADVVIEVVESGRIEVETTAEKTIRALASLGVVVALDDFGKGHNVIGYFSRFPIHAIKIDRSMISAMVENVQVGIIVKGLAQMATELGISALGEGIETQEEFDACVAAGVVEGQGYLLGRPMPMSDLDALVAHEFSQPPSDSPSTGHPTAPFTSHIHRTEPGMVTASAPRPWGGNPTP